MDALEVSQRFLRADAWEEWQTIETDQKKEVPPPPLQTPYPEGATRIDLIGPEELTVGRMSLIETIDRRRSRRDYTKAPLNLEELSFLLWATQGVHEETERRVSRTVPSAGARHAFETYLLVNRVSGLEPGLYRYLSLDHQLCLLQVDAALVDRAHDACHGQFVKESAVTFVWVAIPYRMEWRYGTISPKLIALDAGHVCQNLYLACESIGAGTCAIGAYNQKKLDAVLGVDGRAEFAVYLAPVGKVA